MKHSVYMLILICSVLFAACGKKDDSSSTGTKTSSAPAAILDIHAAKWNLNVNDANEATLVSSRKSPEREVLRVDIKKAGTQTSWHIQLHQAPLTVQAGHRYRVSFRARADSPRNVDLGFARAHEPWTGLGLYTSLVLNPEWQLFQEDFAATADDDNAQIVLNLGGSAISAEFAEVRLDRVGDR